MTEDELIEYIGNYDEDELEASTESYGSDWHFPSKGELPKVGEWVLCKFVDESRDPYIVAMTDAIGDDIFLVGLENEEDNGFEKIEAWHYLPEPPLKDYLDASRNLQELPEADK